MNWDRIEQLLNVAEASVKWPRLRKIHDAALAELQGHAEEKAAPVVRGKPVEIEAEPKPNNGEIKRRTLTSE